MLCKSDENYVLLFRKKKKKYLHTHEHNLQGFHRHPLGTWAPERALPFSKVAWLGPGGGGCSKERTDQGGRKLIHMISVSPGTECFIYYQL